MVLPGVMSTESGWVQVRNAEKARKLLGPDVELVRNKIEKIERVD